MLGQSIEENSVLEVCAVGKERANPFNSINYRSRAKKGDRLTYEDMMQSFEDRYQCLLEQNYCVSYFNSSVERKCHYPRLLCRTICFLFLGAYSGSFLGPS